MRSVSPASRLALPRQGERPLHRWFVAPRCGSGTESASPRGDGFGRGPSTMKLVSSALRATGVACALAATALLTQAGSAHAGVVTILPGAVSHQYFGLNFLHNLKTRDAVGTLSYNGN